MSHGVLDDERVLCEQRLHSCEGLGGVVPYVQDASFIARWQSLIGYTEIDLGNVLMMLWDNEEWLFSHNHCALGNRSCGEGSPSFSRGWLELERRVDGDSEVTIGWPCYCFVEEVRGIATYDGLRL